MDVGELEKLINDPSLNKTEKNQILSKFEKGLLKQAKVPKGFTKHLSPGIIETNPTKLISQMQQLSLPNGTSNFAKVINLNKSHKVISQTPNAIYLAEVGEYDEFRNLTRVKGIIKISKLKHDIIFSERENQISIQNLEGDLVLERLTKYLSENSWAEARVKSDDVIHKYVASILDIDVKKFKENFLEDVIWHIARASDNHLFMESIEELKKQIKTLKYQKKLKFKLDLGYGMEFSINEGNNHIMYSIKEHNKTKWNRVNPANNLLERLLSDLGISYSSKKLADLPYSKERKLKRRKFLEENIELISKSLQGDTLLKIISYSLFNKNSSFRKFEVKTCPDCSQKYISSDFIWYPRKNQGYENGQETRLVDLHALINHPDTYNPILDDLEVLPELINNASNHQIPFLSDGLKEEFINFRKVHVEYSKLKRKIQNIYYEGSSTWSHISDCEEQGWDKNSNIVMKATFEANQFDRDLEVLDEQEKELQEKLFKETLKLQKKYEAITGVDTLNHETKEYAPMWEVVNFFGRQIILEEVIDMYSKIN